MVLCETRRLASALMGVVLVCELFSCATGSPPVPEQFRAYYTRLPHHELPAILPARQQEDEWDGETPNVGFPEDVPRETIVVKIGDTADDFAGRFTGHIDDVFIYSRPLDADEVAALVDGKEAPKGLLGHYTFERIEEDASPDSKPARLKGTARISSKAKQGDFSLELDGQTSHAVIPIRTILDNFTWAAWIKTSSDGTVVANCAETGEWHPGGQTLFLREGKLVFDVGWVGDVEAGTNLADGEWHHVAVTVHRNNANRIELFIDGRPAMESPEGDTPEETTGRLTGRYADIVVRIGPHGRLIFSRETGYSPTWKTQSGDWPLPELVSRENDPGCHYSYARIIENSFDRVLVHWRYMPNLDDVGFAGATHEYFAITANGMVVRKVKQGTKTLDDWNDPANATTQKLMLSADGIEKVSLTQPKLSKQSKKPVAGSPVRESVSGTAVAWWKFDEGLEKRLHEEKDLTKESVSGTKCRVDGNMTLWKKGISGTALAFDGYHSQVRLPAVQSPSVEDALTVEAWVALGAYPWNWAPVIHHSVLAPGPYQEVGGSHGDEVEPSLAERNHRKRRGYYLGIGPYGHPVFSVNGRHLKASVKLSTHEWVHLIGTYGKGQMHIYVDGRECGSVAAAGRIDVPVEDLVIGLNNRQGRATDPVRGPNNHLATIYGIEGLIDEVKVHAACLDSAQVLASYEAARPEAALRENPDLMPRILPGEPGTAKSFGAQYKKLRYHDLWDNLWRTSDYPDVVVKFDQLPASVVYWRGANLGAGWVTEKNQWMEDQSCETGGPHGCSEHMSDKQCRHAHVRVIENTDARVVIHWRYASIDVGYLFPSGRHWTDEYHTIYPDGSGVRMVHFRGGNAGWQDIQFLCPPGTTCRDNVYLQALTVANLKGEVRQLTWEGRNGIPDNPLPDACIERVNFRSDYGVFVIFQEGTHIHPWGHQEQSRYTADPFAGPWNHWPVSQIPSDGRFAVSSDRLTHAALAAADNVVEHGNMAMYGFTNRDIDTLVPLARSWNHPPRVSNPAGCNTQGYDKAQRAYVFRANGSRLTFALDATAQSPTVNPCFVVRNWPSRTTYARLKVDGRWREPGPDCRQGIVVDTDGSFSLVVWTEIQSESRIVFELQAASSSSELGNWVRPVCYAVSGAPSDEGPRPSRPGAPPAVWAK